MNVKEIESRAKEYKKQLGGKIFAFPIHEDDPLSKYAVTVSLSGKFKTYDKPMHISEAAAGIRELIESLKSEGIEIVFERDVRLITREPQMNAPDVTMRKLRKHVTKVTPFSEQGVDYFETGQGEDHIYFSARGLLKISYLSMVEDKLPKAELFMDEYYKLLSARGIGKTPAALRQEVRKKTREEARRWIEQTYDRYIRDPEEIVSIMNRLSESGK